MEDNTKKNWDQLRPINQSDNVVLDLDKIKKILNTTNLHTKLNF